MIKIYLDVCCLSRPFDDQTQTRIAMEAEAVVKILGNSNNSFVLVSSDFIDYEIRNTLDDNRRRGILAFASLASEKIAANDEIKKRADDLVKKGFKALDAVHSAAAEYHKVDVLLTVDDKMRKRCQRGVGNVQISVENPLYWLMGKESNNENS